MCQYSAGKSSPIACSRQIRASVGEFGIAEWTAS
jgi:hypothetical protein